MKLADHLGRYLYNSWFLDANTKNMIYLTRDEDNKFESILRLSQCKNSPTQNSQSAAICRLCLHFS